MLAKTPKPRRHENPKDAFLGSEDKDFWREPQPLFKVILGCGGHLVDGG
jgi:hypothetical protein